MIDKVITCPKCGWSWKESQTTEKDKYVCHKCYPDPWVQQVRLLDVFVVAPFLFYVGTRKELPQALRIGLFALGAATLIYNGKNYINALQNKSV
jgi:hypothetical protein